MAQPRSGGVLGAGVVLDGGPHVCPPRPGLRHSYSIMNRGECVPVCEDARSTFSARSTCSVHTSGGTAAHGGREDDGGVGAPLNNINNISGVAAWVWYSGTLWWCIWQSRNKSCGDDWVLGSLDWEAFEGGACGGPVVAVPPTSGLLHRGRTTLVCITRGHTGCVALNWTEHSLARAGRVLRLAGVIDVANVCFFVT